MGWFWGGDRSNNSNDPTKSLSPELKEFLDSQQPRPYIPAEAPASRASPPPTSPTSSPKRPFRNSATPTADNAAAGSAAESPNDGDKAVVPPQSLFPDGRYAHLWSTYTPPNAPETNTETPIERMVSSQKERRDYMHRAALENCAFEHEMQQTCLTSGSAAQRAKARVTMCREETKAFNRCYSLQGKFLQALGYMGGGRAGGYTGRRAGGNNETGEIGDDLKPIADEDDQDGETDEVIQMHADKLYHRMMDYEASVAEARRQGRPIPPLSSVFNSSRPSPSIEQLLTSQPPELRERAEKNLEQTKNADDLDGGSSIPSFTLPPTTTKITNTTNNTNNTNHNFASSSSSSSSSPSLSSLSLSDLPPQERELAVRAALQEAKMSHLFDRQVSGYAGKLEEQRKHRQKNLSEVVGEPIGKFIVPNTTTK